METSFMVILITSSLLGNSQSLTPEVVSSSGAEHSAGGITLSWTLGETMTQNFIAGNNSLTQGFHQPEALLVNVNIKAFLQGPYSSISGSMQDSLRAQSLIPLTEPYTALGYSNTSGGGESINASVLNTTGRNAIVDWVHLELRDGNDDLLVVATRNTLLQADGDIVDVDGVSAVEFDAPAANYYISVQHRNHLHIMSFAAVPLGDSATSVNFSDGSTATYGTGAQADISGIKALWSGDVTDDGIVKYTGGNNDRDPILVEIGGSVPTNTVAGYLATDVNMDGTVKYTGSQNDRDPILQNIGGAVPTATKAEQMPQ